jgi:hypothetical protein
MENKKKTLQDIFDEDDDLGLLNIKPSTVAPSEEEKRITSFEEINVFFEKNKREPIERKNPQEHSLFNRLKTIRNNAVEMNQLKPYDKHDLLVAAPKEIKTINDIFADEDFDFLNDDDAGLFDFKHVKNTQERESADFVAKRKPCKDFEKYEDILKGVQTDLKNNKRKIVDFKMGNLREGSFYVHNGVLFLLEEITITQKEHYRENGTRVREDGRTRCIFENGTESNMLKRSVEKILYTNGKAITENEDIAAAELLRIYNNISEKDEATGFIYVLKSKSEKKEIKEIPNLYKIGYSTTNVEERIKNALKEPTYLMAEVAIISTYECYNFNPQKMEQLLHNFFGKACLNIDIFDENRQRHTPREWFSAPFSIIQQAVSYIISGEIVGYRYDSELQEIEKR